MRPVIKVCIPVYDVRTWDESLARACIATIKNREQAWDLVVAIQQGTIIEQARNAMITTDDCQAIRQTLDARYSHWLFIDHDVGFTASNIDKLLADDKDVVSGAYRPKDKPEHYVAGMCDDYGRVTEYAMSSTTGLASVDWVGAGFLLVKREALEKAEYPWYWKTVHYAGNRAIPVGEDVYFCLNLKRNLIDIWLDADVILNHEVNRYAIKAV
jgi:hypothetical protein